MAETLSYNEQLLRQAANILSYKGANGGASLDVYGMIANGPALAAKATLGYKGEDGKAPKDFYGMVASLPQETAKALLNTKLRSVHDGQEYTFEQYLVTDNQRLNEARMKDAARDAQIAALVQAVSTLAKGQNLDVDKLLADVRASSAAGVQDAIGSITKTETITAEIKGK